MCGIAVIVCGVRIELSTLSSPLKPPFERLQFSVEDVKCVLSQRGPDSVGEKKNFLQPKLPTCAQESVSGEGTCNLENATTSGELHFIGSTLQLRGTSPIIQPLVDSSGNILAYNGEVFGGIELSSFDNDTEVLLESLEKANDLVPDVLSMIKGPWAIIYWQESSRTLWFGKDAFGRRSLLVHWPTVEDPRFLLSSASPASSVANGSGLDSGNGDSIHRFWEELPCGVYSISFGVSGSGICGEVTKHEWRNNMWKELIEWERSLVVPRPEDLSMSSIQEEKDNALSTFSGFAQTVLVVLKESVRRRTSLHNIFQGETEVVPVAVLFSGGLDSMILAALLDQCLDPKYEVDLLNVSFDGPNAPDRISAKAGIKELKKIAPLRRWKLVEIDADLPKLTIETKRVMSLINPADTYMDLNIGTALWLAARGDGWIHEESDNQEDSQRIRYKSDARILLVGAGADEQCAGYGRHRTKYRNGSWAALDQEMKLDMQRIWKRNLGRDDRCIADNGKEARFPFLDEDVIKTLLDIPLWEIADLEQPSGTGDKKILRQVNMLMTIFNSPRNFINQKCYLKVAKMLGLHEVAKMPKRAIQFGSRIARESNRKNFGSNRAANQASAGSVRFNAPCVYFGHMHGDMIISFQRAESEIGGNESALQALRELIIFPFLYPLEARTLGLKWSRGLLLYGPPGTGKTSLVRAVVQECNAHLIVLSPHSVHRVHAGESEKVLREAFAEASSVSDNKPSIIFIDEIDVLCPRWQESKMLVLLRSSLHSWTRTSLHHLHSPPRVVVVASTNRVDAIDPALRRAGRFDTLVEVSTPNEEDRFKILLLYTKKVNLDASVDLQAIATSCNGYVGADLEALCREATISASKRSVDSLILTLQDFKIAKSVVGPSITRGIAVEIPKVTWDDVGGLKDLKKKFQQAVEWPIKHSAAFTRMGISPMRGILLHGPPGCSKTTLAKAAANAAQASFFSLSCAELFSMYVGEGEALLRNTFQRARLAAPCIIFFDEADVVACKRGEEKPKWMVLKKLRCSTNATW
uniref:Glutamine amidotransferase type-2 domain-containing protein n=1 Tax=Brassica oleracea var. oleracea TaxID=109376 RepID=A0A0D3DAN5_BRAOL